MTISAELVERYTSEQDVDWAAIFMLVHPSAPTRYLIDATSHPEQCYINVDGIPRLFEPVPAQLTLPKRDDSGRSEMSIVWCGIGGEALEFLDAAVVDATQSIKCFYSVAIRGNPEPQLDPWMEFVLSGITVNETTVAATASGTSTINRAFPSIVYRADQFPGLLRR